jgi:hypothetical protein
MHLCSAQLPSRSDNPRPYRQRQAGVAVTKDNASRFMVVSLSAAFSYGRTRAYSGRAEHYQQQPLRLREEHNSGQAGRRPLASFIAVRPMPAFA